jgi:hypothetical protein
MGPLCNASVHLQFADISESGNCSRDFPGNVANVLIASHAKAGRMTRPTIQTTIKNEIVWIEDIWICILPLFTIAPAFGDEREAVIVNLGKSADPCTNGYKTLQELPFAVRVHYVKQGVQEEKKKARQRIGCVATTLPSQ